MGDASDDSRNVACRRCGGFKSFVSSDTVEELCENYNVEVQYGRALVSYYIHKEWLEIDARCNDYDTSKIHYATLDYDKLKSFLGRGGPSSSEQITECMALIGSEARRIGRYSTFCFAERYGLNKSWDWAFLQDGRQHSTEMSDEELIGQVPQLYLEVVRTLCVSDIDSVEYFFTRVLCDEEGFLDKVPTKLAGGRPLDRLSFIVTPKGWKFLDGGNTQQSSQSVFVAMWFAKFTNPLRESIRNVLVGKGYDPVFVDELPTRSDLTPEQRYDLAANSTIDNMIIANIRRARFVIADLSCLPGEKITSMRYMRDDGNPEQRDIVCAGAYFEAGYATALEKPIIYLVNNKQTPHFDVNHIPYITWDENNLEELGLALSNAIVARGL